MFQMFPQKQPKPMTAEQVAEYSRKLDERDQRRKERTDFLIAVVTFLTLDAKAQQQGMR